MAVVIVNTGCVDAVVTCGMEKATNVFTISDTPQASNLIIPAFSQRPIDIAFAPLEPWVVQQTLCLQVKFSRKERPESHFAGCWESV